MARDAADDWRVSARLVRAGRRSGGISGRPGYARRSNSRRARCATRRREPSAAGRYWMHPGHVSTKQSVGRRWCAARGTILRGWRCRRRRDRQPGECRGLEPFFGTENDALAGAGGLSTTPARECDAHWGPCPRVRQRFRFDRARQTGGTDCRGVAARRRRRRRTPVERNRSASSSLAGA